MTSPSPIALRVAGLSQALELHVHDARDRYVSRRIREEGIWEPYETELLLGMLQPGDVMVDVGANIGYFSVIAAAQVGEAGAVVAFEPDPRNCELLRRNVTHNGLAARVEIVEAGLAATDAPGDLYLSEDNFGDHQIFAADDTRDSVPVTLLHGASYLQSRVQRIDLLKVDTQGAHIDKAHAAVAARVRRIRARTGGAVGDAGPAHVDRRSHRTPAGAQYCRGTGALV